MRIGVICCILGLCVTAAVAETVELPSFGIASAPVPNGWQRAREDDAATATRWVLRDAKAKEPTGVIDLQLFPKRSASNVKKLAMAEAARLGGKYSDEPVELGGVEAVEIVIAVKAKANDPVRMQRVRFIKHGNVYLALAERVALDDKATTSAFDHIASDIKLSAPSSPSEALRDRAEPIELRDVKLIMDLPDPFRLEYEGKRQQDYRVINFDNEKSEVEMSVRVISTFNQTLNDFLPTVSKSLARQLKWPEAPTWNRVQRGDKVEVVYSNVIPPGVDDAGKPTKPMQLMLIANQAAAAGGAQMLIIQYTGPADATAKYVERIPAMAKSVRAAARAM